MLRRPAAAAADRQRIHNVGVAPTELYVSIFHTRRSPGVRAHSIRGTGSVVYQLLLAIGRYPPLKVTGTASDR